jgi:hypothetical protein
MAVILQQVMPEGVSLEMLDEVTEEMGVEQDPPDGILFHTHFEQDGRARVVDVWESREAYESFQAARLLPAMQTVAQRHGVQTSPPQPESSLTPVHRVVRGR